MFMLPDFKHDLWEVLARTHKKIFLYGMGNGADKILSVCTKKGIPVEGFFANDAFVRGQSFHGKRVMTFAEVKETYGAENLLALLSFGTARPEVLSLICSVAGCCELYAPDVPVCGETLFDRAFYLAHRKELEETRALFSDEESRFIFDRVLSYKLTGKISYLLEAVSDPRAVWKTLILPQKAHTVADLGAYTGDTAAALLAAPGSEIRKIYAIEPDRRNFQKLSAFAEKEKNAAIIPIRAAAWDQKEELAFRSSGNRNATLSAAGNPAHLERVPGERPDELLDSVPIDFIKYDVEGAEREALLGSAGILQKDRPLLALSLYHRSKDLFALPLLLKEHFPFYRHFYLRRFAGLPAWDIILFAKA
ncbi:MAG: FkbM family methyltransferase [Clostridia bacterium]|nr:FkbM family methyltransferase [Clostridia bacterium]